MRRTVAAVSLALSAAVPLAAQQLTPPGTGGVAALDRTLARLVENRRVLLVAAHPDDEDTELTTLLSRGLGVDAAYLSLSRGEGGQNLIGPELGEALGLLRTGELVAARALDGGRQFFTRAFDFGFSRSLEETGRFWPREALLADVVRVIRRFQPQVVVTVFSGTPRDGHGQHQMSAVIAREAFAVLRDSAWGPRRLYRSTRFDTSGTSLVVPTAGIDEETGRTFHQLAMASRSLHRSQDMGQLQRLGPSFARLSVVEDATGRAPGAPVRGTGMADAVDAMFAGIDAALPPGLDRYAALIDSARTSLTPRAVGRALPFLVRALAELRREGPPAFRALKEPLLEEAVAAAAGIVVDAAANDAAVVPGQEMQVRVAAWSAGGVPVRTLAAGVAAPAGWRVSPRGESAAVDGGPQPFFSVGNVPSHGFGVQAPDDAAPTTPYFLVRPRQGALYDWGAAPEEVRGEPLDPPLLVGWVRLGVGGATIRIERAVSYRYRDQALGEVRRPISVVPAVGVRIAPDLLVWPLDDPRPRAITVELTHGARTPTSGEVRLELPVGWPEVPVQRFSLEEEGARRAFTFQVSAPARLRPGTYAINAVATDGSRRYERASVPIDYPHIRPIAYTSTASLRVEAMPLALPPVRSVGYVRGASDLVPEALRSIGVPLTVLSAADLERGDLSVHDVIVIGSRAYETEPALVAANGRLLDYARAGGRVLVQYQQYQFEAGGFAPFRLTMARPHDRVTDEASPVRVLDPDSPALRTPNAIGPADWDGWVQERGLYFASDWDAAYRPLLEMGDGAERLRGGLLVARLGRGLYTYTGLSFFRELPAGVPGAYRLFMNLLGMEPADVP